MAKTNKKKETQSEELLHDNAHDQECECGDPKCNVQMGCDASDCGGCCGPAFEMPYESRSARCSKTMVAFSASALFLLMAVFVGMQIWGNPWYKNIRAEFTSSPYARTITVDGVGKVNVKPDVARVSLSIVSTGKTVKVVTDETNSKMNVVVNEMKKMGIEPADIQTSSYSLYPEYDYGTTIKPSLPKIIGYNLTQTVDVKIRDLAKADDVLDKATAAGVNQVGTLSFDVDDASQVKKDARTEAFQKAKEKAAEMAVAAGVSLGKVVTFSESSGGGVMPYANFTMKAMDSGMVAATAPSIEPGSQEFNVNVSVTYEIN